MDDHTILTIPGEMLDEIMVRTAPIDRFNIIRVCKAFNVVEKLIVVVDDMSILKDVCFRGDILNVMRSFEFININNHKNRALFESMFGAARGGHSLLIKFLWPTWPAAIESDYTKQKFVDLAVIKGASLGGHLSILKELPREHITHYQDEIMYAAAEGGHAVVCKYILERMTENENTNVYDTVCDVYKRGLEGACEGRQYELLITLQKECEQHKPPIAIQWDSLFDCACEGGDSTIILHTYHYVKVADINQGLYRACKGGNIDATSAILRLSKLYQGDTRDATNHTNINWHLAFSGAAQGGHTHIIKFIEENSGISHMKNIKKPGTERTYVKHGIANGSLSLIDLVFETLDKMELTINECINIVSWLQHTVLVSAFTNGYTKIAKILGAKINNFTIADRTGVENNHTKK